MDIHYKRYVCVVSQERPPIPAAVKRAARQRCGFGCVICGLPLYEYDHVVPFSEVEEHGADNLVLLCPQHHAEKTKGFLSTEEVVQANQHPRNRQTGESHPFGLRYHGAHCEAIIGGCQHIWPEVRPGLITMPLLIDDTPIVAFRAEEDRLLLTVQLFDERNELLVQVLDNELVFSAEQWDVEFQGRRLTVRLAARNIFVAMTFDPPNCVVLDRAHIWRNGIEIEIQPDRIFMVNNRNTVSGSVAHRCQVGLAVGDPPKGLGGAIFMGSMRAPYPADAPTEARVLRIATGPPPIPIAAQ